jgi:hypothetical protein
MSRWRKPAAAQNLKPATAVAGFFMQFLHSWGLRTRSMSRQTPELARLGEFPVPSESLNGAYFALLFKQR